jgi:pentatricopeptide repeat protein
MVADYYELTGDLRLVREVLPGVRCVLDWFRAHGDVSGLPTKLPYWNNVDWCPDWDRGQPPGWDTGATAVISCQLIVALEAYRTLIAATGGAADRADINKEITDIRRAARAAFWNAKSRIVRDASTVDSTSQYSTAWALLADIVPEDEKGALADALSVDESLAPASFFGLYYVVEALCRLGRYRDALRIYDRWREMAEFGLSTWAEETTYWRSLCHAWSAHPALFFLKRILGASPAGPGFDGLIVAPKPSGLPRASGAFATPLGPVTVEWSIRSGEIEIAVSAPEDLAVEIVAPKAHDGTDVHGPVSGRRSVRAVAPFEDSQTTKR